jgi:hypothetical protein
MRNMRIEGLATTVAAALGLTLALGACGNTATTNTAETTAAAEATTEGADAQTYTATVTDDQGNPVADVGVAFCGGGMCNIAYTDEKGVATYVGALPDLEVHVAIPPEGYAENDESLTDQSNLAFTLERR